MKENCKYLFFYFWILFSLDAYALNQPQLWDLKKCIDYALMHHYQYQQAKIKNKQSYLSLEQSKLALFPDLQVSIGNEI